MDTERTTMLVMGPVVMNSVVDNIADEPAFCENSVEKDSRD